MQNESILLDTCCFVNLCASGCLEEALQHDEWRYVLSGIVADEALYIQRENTTSDDAEFEEINSRKLATNAGMNIIEVGEASEIDLYVRLAIPLDDGEAHGLAVAKSKGFCFGTDDRKAIRIASLPEVDVKVITTPEIVKHWLDDKLVETEPRDLLSNIECYGRFRPRKNTLLADWWASLL